jgi:hypothetical protein
MKDYSSLVVGNGQLAMGNSFQKKVGLVEAIPILIPYLGSSPRNNTLYLQNAGLHRTKEKWRFHSL